jgi:hypothetical protein
MAEERNGLQKIAQIGEDLWFCIVDISLLKEQDINARIMKDGMFKQLTANIKKRGQLESVPFCCMQNNTIEIVSGHHRIKAAKMAGLTSIPILLDVSGLNRSQIAAKQLAHNSISGFDDQDMLKEITKIIDNVDDMLESFMENEFIEPNEELSSLVHIKSDLDWKQISLVFLDNEIEDFDKFLKNLDQQPKEVWVADVRSFDKFCEGLKKTQKVQDVKNVSASVSAMVKICNRFFDENGYEKNKSYVSVSKILGGNTCSKEAGKTIKEALDKMVKNKEANSKWEAMEILARRYLDGEK